MASTGNPNQAMPFDVQSFFKPMVSNPSNSNTQPQNPSSSPFPAPSPYTPPSPPFFHPQYHQFYMPLPSSPTHSNFQDAKSLSFPSPPLNPYNAGTQILALINSSHQNPDFPPQNQLPKLQPPPLAEFMGSGVPSVGSSRVASCKLPKGRRLSGARMAYDIDTRLSGEVQPQLEVTPITKYGSDPQLLLGRQIAVNKSYICYGLKGGSIRILNLNTALRSLFRGHTQRITDMAFFAEDVHLLASVSLEGRVFVWKILEGPDEEDKPQITGKIVIAVQILSDQEYVHPRVCWHRHKQEVLVAAIGKHILRIDTMKVGKNEVYSTDAPSPLQCPIDKLIDGIQLVGKHDGEVTDVSMCQWMIARLVSASTDGTIKIWDDRKAVPLTVLRPHDGQPVYSATFLTAPHRPDHIILITGGPLNQEIKVWTSASEEGWLLPSNTEKWTCTQTLDLKSSAEPQIEDAFFNQVVALSQAGLFLLANAKRNAIYAVHLEYGSCPAASRMDYIAEFSVTMPILSFTGTSDPPDEHVVKIYCVQTLAIQQYALELCQCIPPPLENIGFEKLNSSVSLDVANTKGYNSFDKPSELPFYTSVPKPSKRVSSSENLSAPRFPSSSHSTTEVNAVQELSTSNIDPKSASALASTASDADISCVASPPAVPPSPRLSRQHSGFHNYESTSQLGDHVGNRLVVDYSVDRQMDTVRSNLSGMHSSEDDLRNDDKKIISDEKSSAYNPPIIFKHPTHLVTPSEILMAATSSETTNVNEGKSEGEVYIQDVVVNNNARNAELEVKVVGETRSSQNNGFSSHSDSQNRNFENREKFFCSQASDLGIQMSRDSSAMSRDAYVVDECQQADGVGASGSHVKPNVGEEEHDDSRKDLSGKVPESAMHSTNQQSPAPGGKGKKHKGKVSQASGNSSPSSSAFNSADSSTEPGANANLPSAAAAFPQIAAMQEMLNQLITTQKEMQKQMSNIVNTPVTKEGKRLEAAIGRNIEKVLKANTDAQWVRFQEENAKNEKLMREHTQQLMSLITNFMNKDLAVMLDKVITKELAGVGPAVVRTITPVIEKNVTSAINESFQRGVGDKAVNQLEKSVNSKLEAIVARQIQAQFQTSGKQALQEALRTSVETSVVPAFESSCKALFEQVDAAFQKGMVEHTNAALQQLDSTSSSLAISLRDAINSASSIAKTLSGEFAEGQRKILALAAAGANSNAATSLASQLSNGPLGGLHDKSVSKVVVPLDPTKELSKLLSEHKYEEAFTIALQRSDLSVVSWLCSHVDLRTILSTNPFPLSQGVLLSLLQQLTCDINKDTPRKLAWMLDVATAINPGDQMIAVHVRPIFQEVYKRVHEISSSPLLTGAEHASIRALTYVINYVIMTCK